MSGPEDELRRDSPAYAPDDAWEAMPAPLAAVIGVRLEPRAARALARIAQATGRSQSRVVREWVMERLADPAEAFAGRIAEMPAGYRSAFTAEADDELLRSRFRPMSVTVLLVGESAPAGGTFFYNADSKLFHATREAFVEAYGPMPSGHAFLDEFRNRGAWLVDLAPRPVNRQRGRPRQAVVEAGLEQLAGIIVAERPRLVIAVKSTLENTVRAAAARAGVEANSVHILPFPLYQWRGPYIRGLAQLLTRREGSPRPTTSTAETSKRQTLHGAMVEVLRGRRGPMPAREIANEINFRRSYERRDGGSLGFQQVLVRARKHPNVFRVTRDGVSLA